MNSVAIQTGKIYKQWPNVLDTIIVEMNIIRKRELPNINDFDNRFVNDTKQVRKVIYNKRLVKRLKKLKKSL